jgi:hypothetical protein
MLLYIWTLKTMSKIGIAACKTSPPRYRAAVAASTTW